MWDASTTSASTRNFARISLGHANAEEEGSKRNHEGGPLEPSPTCGGKDKAADDRSDAGADERCKRKERVVGHRLLRSPDISESTLDEDEVRSAKESGKKAADCKGCEVLGQTRAEDEEGEERKTAEVDWCATETLGEMGSIGWGEKGAEQWK